MQKLEVQLKRSEMGEHKTLLDPLYFNYPCAETSGPLYAELLRGSLSYLLDRKSYIGVKVLDIGCGYGWVAEAFAKHNATTYAVDINWSLCCFSNSRAKQKNLDVSVVCCDGEHLPFKDIAFDIATFNASLHHFPRPLFGLNESLRAARSIYIINEPRYVPSINKLIEFLSKGFNKKKQYFAKAGQNYDSEMDKEEHQFRFSINSLEKYCTKTGCTIEAKGYWCYVPPMLQKMNNSTVIWLCKNAFKVLNTLLPNLGHTFFLRATRDKQNIG